MSASVHCLGDDRRCPRKWEWPALVAAFFQHWRFVRALTLVGVLGSDDSGDDHLLGSCLAAHTVG